MRQAKLQPCRKRRGRHITMRLRRDRQEKEQGSNSRSAPNRGNYARPQRLYYTTRNRIYHLSGCAYAGTRGKKVSLQSAHPTTSRSFSNCWNDFWKSFTVSYRIISSGILLYTRISPSADRRAISKKCRFRMSTNCLLCLTLPDLGHKRSALDN